MSLITAHKSVSIKVKSLSEQVFQSPKVVNAPKEVCIESIIDLISRTFYKAGQSISKDGSPESATKETVLLAKMLYDEICDTELDYNWVTIKELEICFKNGLRMRYGEYFGLNIKTFLQWIDGFKEKERDEEIRKRRPKKQVSTELKLTDEEKKANRKQVIHDLIAFFKKHKYVQDKDFYLYDFFNEKGLMIKDLDYKLAVKEKAIEILKKENLLKKNTEKTDERRKAKSILDKVLKGTYNGIKNKCKVIALQEYLEKNQEKLEEIKEILI